MYIFYYSPKTYISNIELDKRFVRCCMISFSVYYYKLDNYTQTYSYHSKRYHMKNNMIHKTYDVGTVGFFYDIHKNITVIVYNSNYLLLLRRFYE